MNVRGLAALLYTASATTTAAAAAALTPVALAVGVPTALYVGAVAGLVVQHNSAAAVLADRRTDSAAPVDARTRGTGTLG
ncbi:hypothetical protein MMPV_009648 [Pyropia vietnamensis]